MSTDRMEQLRQVFSIVGEIVGSATTTIPVAMNAIELLIKAYHDIKDSPGDFDLKEFQRRLDALPDYGEEVK